MYIDIDIDIDIYIYHLQSKMVVITGRWVIDVVDRPFDHQSTIHMFHQHG